MKIGIIVGSHRKESQSTKVGRFVERHLQELVADVEIYFLDLRNNPLPLWQEDMWEEGSDMQAMWQPYSTELGSCDAFVVVSPEWSGMAPAGLKNFFLYCKYELSHKPALLVGVSSGRGGAYPIAELRMSSYKNTYICYIPNHVVVRKVEDILNTDEPDTDNKSDVYIRKRLVHALKVLEQYSKAFRQIRDSGVEDRDQFPNGM